MSQKPFDFIRQDLRLFHRQREENRKLLLHSERPFFTGVFGKNQVFFAAVYAALRRLPGRKNRFDRDAIVDSLHENRLLRQRNKKSPEICYDR